MSASRVLPIRDLCQKLRLTPIAAGHPRLLLLRWSSSTGSEHPGDRPNMYHLEHIQKRLEHTVPLMFRTRLDYTFYRRDVICEDHIFNLQKIGLHQYIYHLGMVSVIGQMCFPYIRMEPLSISPIIEDGSVRLRWRISYLTWINALNFKNFNREFREKNARWFDGYSIFYADGEGLVYKVIIQKMMPDDESFAAKQKKKIAEKIKLLQPESAATNFVPIEAEEAEESAKQKRDNRRTIEPKD